MAGSARFRVDAPVIATETAPTSSRRAAALAVLAGAVLVGALCGACVRHGCLHPPPPVTTPDPGTARAALCHGVGFGQPWTQALCTAAVALLLLAVGGAWRRVGFAALLAVNVALAILALTLTAASTA